MHRNVKSLTENEYDLVIVGGGIFGACAAWDAILRGLTVALVDKGDFANATSNNHFRMVHGGIRYLQHGDIYRVRESSYERSALLRIAPHLVHPLPIVIPTYGHGIQGPEILRVGLLLYDAITLDRNKGISDPLRRIPSGRIITRNAVLEMFPEIDSKDLTGAAIFYDGQIYNPARLALSFIKSAAAKGADVANYVEVCDFIQRANRIVGVKVIDRLTSDEFNIHGRVVLNAAGPWSPFLLKEKLGVQVKPEPVFSRDACFVVNRPLIKDYALTVLGKTKDPDAIFSRGHRHLFIVPWQEKTLIGVWHVVHNGQPEDFTVTEKDLQNFLTEINSAYPVLRLKVNDVSNWMAGLVLFGEEQVSEKDLRYGHRSQIINHSKEDNIQGLITLIGVRFTTARGMAENAVNLVFKKIGGKFVKSKTAFSPIYGGQIENFDKLTHRATEERPLAVSKYIIPDLLHKHGSAYHEIFNYIIEDPSCAETVGCSNVINAEVVHAVRKEMAQKLSDVVFRRTDLGTGGYPGKDILRECANIMAEELNWSTIRIERELNEVENEIPHF
jgi:glycerol-3-phosphate dehydrogenase